MIPPWRQGERWLGPLRPFVHSRLPPAPASVLEIGCGHDGGFVPGLRQNGYEAVGIDPDAPDGARLRAHRLRALRAAAARRRDRRQPLAPPRERHRRRTRPRAAALRPGGAIVVAEWAWERFDEPTARWCFARLDPPADGSPAGCSGAATGGWPRARRGTRTSRTGRAARPEPQRPHPGRARCALRAHARATTRRTSSPISPTGSEQDEQAAIDAGEIRATGIRYAGRRVTLSRPAASPAAWRP